MSLFTLPASQRKRKRENGTSKQHSTKKVRSNSKSTKPQRTGRDESISGSDSDREEYQKAQIIEGSENDSDSDDVKETGAERRLRLAERYLDNIRGEVEEEHGFDAAEIDRDLIAERLKEDVAETKGRLYRHIASNFAFPRATTTSFRSHTASVTSISVCSPYVYTVSSDTILTKWELAPFSASAQTHERVCNRGKSDNGRIRPPPPARRRPSKILSIKSPSNPVKDPNAVSHHFGPILSVAASSDGQFVVTGGDDHHLIVWSANTLQPLKVFSQHRDSVTSLAFRRGTNQLYSASKDRTVKTWSLNELAYVETLFGHQDCIVDVAALAQERCLSAGARDRTARLWKVVDETQLIFLGGGGGNKKPPKNDATTSANIDYAVGSLDRVAFIDEDTFVTGSDNGSLMLWNVQKKKPVFTYPLAHGLQPAEAPEQISAERLPESVESIPQVPQPRWITALATIPYSDIIVSGSWDGWVRAWKVSGDKRKIEALGPVGKIEEHVRVNRYANARGHRDERSQTNGLDGEDANGRINGACGKGQIKGKLEYEEIRHVRGVINDLEVFERGERGKENLCIVAAVGREHRLGRWMQLDGKNDAIVLDIPRKGAGRKKRKKRKRKTVTDMDRLHTHVDGSMMESTTRH